MINITPVGNAYAFSGAAFGWLCPRHVSLLAWLSRSLSMLLNAGRCECPWPDLALLLFTREGFGELLKENSSSVWISTSPGMMGLFPLSQKVWCFAYMLSYASPLLRLYLFSTWAHRRSFSSCKYLARSCNSLIFLACSSYFFSMS